MHDPQPSSCRSGLETLPWRAGRSKIHRIEQEGDVGGR